MRPTSTFCTEQFYFAEEEVVVFIKLKISDNQSEILKSLKSFLE
jgi:hypothetical protein